MTESNIYYNFVTWILTKDEPYAVMPNPLLANQPKILFCNVINDQNI